MLFREHKGFGVLMSLLLIVLMYINDLPTFPPRGGTLSFFMAFALSPPSKQMAKVFSTSVISFSMSSER